MIDSVNSSSSLTANPLNSQPAGTSVAQSNVRNVCPDIIRRGPPERITNGSFGIGAAHYRDLLTRTAPRMSDDEFLYAAREQARIDFANGIRESDEIIALQKEFISVVSPDRQSLVRSQFKNPSYSPNRPHHLRDLLDAITRLEKGKDVYGSVSGVTFTPCGEIHDVTIHDASGRPLVRYSRGSGWSALLTDEEWSRRREIFAVYNDEWFALHNESKRENNRFELLQSDAGVGSFDAIA